MRRIELELRIPGHQYNKAIKAVKEIVETGKYVVELYYSKNFHPHYLSINIKTTTSTHNNIKFALTMKKRFELIKKTLGKHHLSYKLKNITIKLEEDLPEEVKRVIEYTIKEDLKQLFQRQEQQVLTQTH